MDDSMVAQGGDAYLNPSQENSTENKNVLSDTQPAYVHRLNPSMKSESIDQSPWMDPESEGGPSPRPLTYRTQKSLQSVTPGSERRATVSQMTKEDHEALKEYRRGKLLCCDKEKFVHRFTLTMLLLDFAMLGLMTAVYWELIFWDKNDINVFMFFYEDMSQKD